MTTEQIDKISESLGHDTELIFKTCQDLAKCKAIQNIVLMSVVEYPTIPFAIKYEQFFAIVLAAFASGFLHGKQYAEVQQLENLVSEG